MNKFHNPATAGLRIAHEFFVPKPRIDFSARQPLHALPKLWNAFDDSKLKNTVKPDAFKDGLKLYFLNDLAAHVQCNNAFCRDCFPE